jgi:hypothetical protein
LAGKKLKLDIFPLLTGSTGSTGSTGQPKTSSAIFKTDDNLANHL